MDRGKVLNLTYFKKTTVFFKENWCLFLVTFVFLGGITFGIFANSGSSFLNSVFKGYSDSYIELLLNGKFKKIFFSLFLLNSSIFALIFVFGTSVTGVTLVPSLIFLKGFLLGKIVFGLYSNYSLNGIVFNALAVVPPSILSTVFLILSAKISIFFSLRIVGIFVKDSAQRNLSQQFKSFWRIQVVYYIPIIFSCLLEAWLSGRIVNMLNF